MVASLRVLGRACLAADVPAVEPRHGRGAADVHAAPHSLDDRFEVFGVDHRILLFVETAVDRIAPFDALDDVGDVVVAPVGQDGREVGHLQRRAAQFALPDRERDDRQCVPRTVIDPVVVFARRDVARPFV